MDILARLVAFIAENGKSERHRLRASQLLNGARQRAADALAHATGVREEVLDGKGLSQKGTQVAVFDFSGLSMEKLQALARGDFKALGAGEAPKVVEGEVVKKPEE